MKRGLGDDDRPRQAGPPTTSRTSRSRTSRRSSRGPTRTSSTICAAGRRPHELAATVMLVGRGWGSSLGHADFLLDRRYEIGLRKAMGASDHEVFIQFLLEALVLAAGRARSWARSRERACANASPSSFLRPRRQSGGAADRVATASRARPRLRMYPAGPGPRGSLRWKRCADSATFKGSNWHQPGGLHENPLIATRSALLALNPLRSRRDPAGADAFYAPVTNRQAVPAVQNRQNRYYLWSNRRIRSSPGLDPNEACPLRTRRESARRRVVFPKDDSAVTISAAAAGGSRETAAQS